MLEMAGKYTKAKIMIDDVEESCMAQITSFLNHPAFTNPIAIMPDCHAGKGSVIGFTMEMTDKVIPNVIGVDIGCGIRSINIGKELPISVDLLDHKIRQRIPFGAEVHDKAILNMKNDFPWHEVKVQAESFLNAMVVKDKMVGLLQKIPDYSIRWFEEKCRSINCDLGRAIKSIGTLGGGNHFCEIGRSNGGDYWLTVHSGARNFALKVCNYWQNTGSKVIRKEKQALLKSRIEKIREEYTGMEIKKRIKLAREEVGLDQKFSSELQHLEDAYAIGYLYDMIFAQKYAAVNREYMIKTILNILGVKAVEDIETVHNYIDFSDFIIRKGAIKSYTGKKMCIPFNMRDGILICEGKSNPEWNYSAPHGAGRVMSRAAAKKSINLDVFKEQMAGIYSTSVDRSTLDEAPDAYKNSKIIEKAIEPTAEIIDRIKPIHSMKDSSESNSN